MEAGRVGRDCSFHRGKLVTDSAHSLPSGKVSFDLPQLLGCCQERLRHFTDLVARGATLLPGVWHWEEGAALHLSLFLFPVEWRPAQAGI